MNPRSALLMISSRTGKASATTNRKVIERRLFAGLQFQFDFRQRLSAIADNNEPFVEGDLDQGPFEIETAQTPLDLRLKLLLERVSIDDTIQLGWQSPRRTS